MLLTCHCFTQMAFFFLIHHGILWHLQSQNYCYCSTHIARINHFSILYETYLPSLMQIILEKWKSINKISELGIKKTSLSNVS